MRRNVLQVVSWGGTHPGNLTALFEALAQELGPVEQGYLFPDRARGRAWMPELTRSAFVDFLPDNPREQVMTIRRAVRKTGCRIVHSWFSRYDLASWLAALGMDAQVVWHLHSERAIPRTPSWWFKETVKYRLIGRTVHAVAVSDRVREWIIGRGMPGGRTLVVENGADIRRASSPSASREQLRSELGISRATTCLVLFGWEPDRKGIDIALRGLQPLIGERDFRLLLVANAIRARAFVATTLRQSIPDWAPLVVAREVVADFYAAADIFLSASRFEGFPWAVTEAVAAGTPVISSDIGALAWAKRIPSVVFFPLAHPELLADAVRTIVSWTQTEREARTAAGKRLVAENYSAEAWARRMVAVYRGL